LSKVWGHANVTQARKLEVFNACVLSKLLYGLHTAWLNKAERERLDAFHARCLRKIFKIQPSYISHVSNALVWEKARVKPLSHTLLQHQLRYYGHIARLPGDSPVRKTVLQRSDVAPRAFEGQRRRGRPRNTWSNKVYTHALRAAGGMQQLRDQVVHPEHWRKCITEYIDGLELSAVL